MPQARGKNQKLTQFWKHHIEQWAESGLSQNAYCRENELKPNRFTYWKIKFKNQTLPAGFVQVPLPKITEVLSLSGQNGLRLNMGNEFQIEIPNGFSQTTLTQVLQILRRL